MDKFYAYFGGKVCCLPIIDNKLEVTRAITEDEEPIISAVKINDLMRINVNIDATKNQFNNMTIYEDLIRRIKTEKIISLLKLTNRFKVFVDFAIYDAKKAAIEEGVKIHDITAEDEIQLHAVDENNDLCYNVVKTFKIRLPYSYPVIRTGITSERKAVKYIRIKNISIYAETDDRNTNAIRKLSQTLLDTTISTVSPTILQAKEQMVEIYNSSDINFSVIKCVESPRTIDLEIKVALDGFTIPYDDTTIINLIEGNINTYDKNKNGIPDDEEGYDPDHGDEPDEEESNYFEYYERCTANDPKAQLVVSDDSYDETATNPKEAKYSDVIKDIPNVAIGDWVRFERILIIEDGI